VRHPNTDWKLKPRKEGALIGGNIGASDGDGTDYSVPDSKNLLVHYKFNETEGTEASDETENYDGTISGTTSWGTGKSGNCLTSIDGDGYVTIPVTAANLLASAYTVSFWIKPGDGQPATVQYIWGVADATCLVGCYLRTNGSLKFLHYIDSDNTIVITTSSLFDNGAASSFTHVAYSVSSHAGIIVYINGEEDSHSSTVGFKKDMSDYSVTYKPTILSRNASGTQDYYFNGSIDDFRIYRGIITDNQAIGLA
jgi:hypothetical protein